MSESKPKNRPHSAEFKTQVVLELIRGDITLSQAAVRYNVKDTMLSRWKKEFLERASQVFSGASPSSEQDRRLSELESLFKEQSLELAILKKALSRSAKTSGGSS
jgi:putative transposase